MVKMHYLLWALVYKISISELTLSHSCSSNFGISIWVFQLAFLWHLLLAFFMGISFGYLLGILITLLYSALRFWSKFAFFYGKTLFLSSKKTCNGCTSGQFIFLRWKINRNVFFFFIRKFTILQDYDQKSDWIQLSIKIIYET